MLQRLETANRLPHTELRVSSDDELSAHYVEGKGSYIMAGTKATQAMDADELSFMLGHQLARVHCRHDQIADLVSSNASQIVSGFMGSEEYTNNNYSSAETIEVLYNTMLGRPSDPAGKQYWIDVLYSQGINAVIEGFRSSQEFSIICNDYGITP